MPACASVVQICDPTNNLFNIDKVHHEMRTLKALMWILWFLRAFIKAAGLNRVPERLVKILQSLMKAHGALKLQ